MKINRNNYEEYFLLYTDNELSAADKQAVDDFIRQNPDLQKEFTMLQQSTFSADDKIIFRNKEVLMHVPVNEGLIHHENYQELFILYSDEELTTDEKAAVENFVYHHPEYQAEFKLIQSVKLIPDLGITFPDKDKLYRQPAQGAKAVVFTWTRVAVAAALVIFAGILWLAKPRLAVSNELVKSDLKPALRITTESLRHELPVTSLAAPAKIPLRIPQAASGNQIILPGRENAAPRNTPALNSIPRILAKSKMHEDQTGISGSGNPPLATNDAPATNAVHAENAGIDKRGIVDGKIAARSAPLEVVNAESRTSPLAIHSLVQTEAVDETSTLILASNDDADAITIAGIPVDKKGSIRGLFRKASRFIDKTTSIRPAKKHGLVIGNIEIAFQ